MDLLSTQCVELHPIGEQSSPSSMAENSWLNWYPDRTPEESVVRFAQTLKGAGSQRVLDFGCGTGRHIFYLARLGFEVYGFDWSEDAVKIAREELSRQGLGAELRVWDMNHVPLPYDDSFFDAVLVVRVIHHATMEKVRRAASEVQRITKAGGYLYVEVPTHEKAMRLKREGSKSVECEPGTFVPSEGDEIGIPHHHFKKDELVALFPGFTPLALEERYEHHCLTARKR